MRLIKLLLHLLILQLIINSTRAQSSPCDRDFSFAAAAAAKNITHCKKLHTFAAEFGWKIYSNSNSNTSHNHTSIDILFSAVMPPAPRGWLAWGLNPGPKPKMVGTRALIAFNNGTNGALMVYPYNITGQTKNKCKLESSSNEITVKNAEANFTLRNYRAVIFASLSLPQEYNISMLHMVWQLGNKVVDYAPRMHGRRLENFDSIETIDLYTGYCVDYRHLRLRYAHGILSALGWGTLLPIGAIVARYFREFPFPRLRWFRVHVSCQMLAFLIGAIAWSFGLFLMNSTHFKSFLAHKVVGILVFCLASLQMMAIWLIPQRSDKYRMYWNIYHHFSGYTLIVLAIINIFQGLSMLDPSSIWRWIYIGILTTLSAIALGFEITVWGKFGVNKYLTIKNNNAHTHTYTHTHTMG